MSRPVTLFTGQWADLPLSELAALVKKMGFDGMELACWGDHFNVNLAAGMSVEEFLDGSEPDKTVGAAYRRELWQLIGDSGLNVWAISAHLVGQAVCDLIDPRHKDILPAEIWGKGVEVFPGQPGYDAEEAEAIRQRAAAQLSLTGIASRFFMNDKPASLQGYEYGVKDTVVNGFTGSSVWPLIYAFPPTNQCHWQAGFDDFARRFMPILDLFDEYGVRFGLEVHPTEIAFDTATASRAIQAVNGHKRFGFNFDPSHLAYQGVDYRKFIYTHGERIFHVHDKDVQWGVSTDGSVGVFGGFTTFAQPQRHWDFRSIGHGMINFDQITCALNDIGYSGTRSIEWEDSRMDRVYGATEAAEAIRKKDFTSSKIAFDAQFDRK